MNVVGQFSKGVAWMAAGSWIEQSFNFIIFVVLARLLGAEALGLAAMAVSFAVLAAALVRETFSEFLIARANPTKADHDAVFWTLLGLSLLLAALMIACSDPIARFYGEPEVAGYLIALAPSIVMIALSAVPVAILRRQMQFRILSIRAIAGVVIGGIAGIALALAGFGVWALIHQYLVLLAVNLVMAWQAAKWLPGPPPPLRAIGDVAAFGTRLIGLRTAELTATQAPLVMVGATLGANALGLFSFAWRLIEISSVLIVTPLRMASQSAFAALSHEGGNPGALLKDLLSTIGLLAFPCFAGLALLADQLVPLIFGTEFLPAVPVLQIMCAAGLFFCFEKVQQSYCLAKGRPGPIARVAWGEAALGVLLIWAFGGMGLLVVAAIFSLRYLALWPIRFEIVRRMGGIAFTEFLALNVKPVLVTLVMAALVFLFKTQTNWGALPTLITGTLIGAGIVAIGATLFLPDRVQSVIRLARGQATP